MGTPLAKADAVRFFSIRLSSIAPGTPLPYDLYLSINGKPTLFKRKREILPPERIELLARNGGDRLLVAEEERGDYLLSLERALGDPSSPEALRSQFIKESAYLHLHSLFTQKDLAPVIEGARGLVTDILKNVCGDVLSTAALMRLSSHDYYTYNHSVNVAVYSVVLARQAFGENKSLLVASGLGGLLHDLGKRKITWEVINKTGPLTPAEWDEIKRHPTYGREVLDGIPGVPEESRLVVQQHHESIDGRGYPRGLSGDEISKVAKVVTIADVFDALTTDRSYHRALPPVDALKKMFNMQPGKFDPDLFKLFQRNFDNKPAYELEEEFDPCTPQPLPKASGQ